MTDNNDPEHEVSIDSEDDSESESEVDRMLSSLDAAIDLAEDRIDGRYRDKETEKIRIKWARTLSTLTRTKRQVASDKELKAMRQELEEVKAELADESAAGVAGSGGHRKFGKRTMDDVEKQ